MKVRGAPGAREILVCCTLVAAAVTLTAPIGAPLGHEAQQPECGEPSSAKRAVEAIVMVGSVALRQELQIIGDAISSTSSPNASVMLEVDPNLDQFVRGGPGVLGYLARARRRRSSRGRSAEQSL